MYLVLLGILALGAGAMYSQNRAEDEAMVITPLLREYGHR